ncbi:MAG TPA: transcription antitermination factor NusB, partial [Actinomycetota bacterium]|nr:transcription antitermination factor NusB [Actinomycetota bacterium]
MLPRTRARKHALDILHAADSLDRPVAEVLADEPGVKEFTRELVLGVIEHRTELDDLIRRYADRWALERMPIVDRNLLRIGIFELLHRDDIPPAVSINEAVELAKLLSTEDSGRFVNGLLGRVAREH